MTLTVLHRNNVKTYGSGKKVVLFAHGYGCDQNMWRLVAPAFEADHRVVLFDHVGAGGSDLTAYSRSKYASLTGYAQDVIEICTEMNLSDVVYVGHSVSAMIGVVAAGMRPDLFERLVLIGPSPRYINVDDYIGGFSEEDILGLLDFLDSNHLGWAAQMAPVIMGNGDRPELGQELSNSFCRTDPDIAKHFARVTFTADNRDDLSKVKTPTLILQCGDDAISPEAVGEYTHRNIPGSRLVKLDATGHCPHMSAPVATATAIRSFVASLN